MNRQPSPSDLPTPYFDAADRRERILDRCAALEPLFRRPAEQRHIPGVAYGVLVDGELIFEHAFGVANVETGAPVSAETVFRIASMTKSFAALAILQLRDRGKVRLDDPVAAYVPEFAELPYPTADSVPITVRQLLTMSAGWPQDDPWGDRQLYRSDAEMSRFFAEGVSWSNPPGVTFEYSNYGYMVLGRIITNVAGMPMIQYVDEQILRPLGMDATVWNAADVPATGWRSATAGKMRRGKRNRCSPPLGMWRPLPVSSPRSGIWRAGWRSSNLVGRRATTRMKASCAAVHCARWGRTGDR
jgi:CubicO group peptidase (beta-lactamase class C family)